MAKIKPFTSFHDVYFAPRTTSTIIDLWGTVHFLTSESYPNTKIIVERNFVADYVLRLKGFGQSINSLNLLTNLTWNIYINNEIDINYREINIILADVKDLKEIIVFKERVKSVKLTATYSASPIANADIGSRIQGWVERQ